MLFAFKIKAKQKQNPKVLIQVLKLFRTQIDAEKYYSVLLILAMISRPFNTLFHKILATFRTKYPFIYCTKHRIIIKNVYYQNFCIPFFVRRGYSPS